MAPHAITVDPVLRPGDGDHRAQALPRPDRRGQRLAAGAGSDPSEADALPPLGGPPAPPRGRPRRGVSELAVSFERRGEVIVVRLAGNLDIYTVPAFRSRAAAARAETPLVVDLRQVDLLDSSGLGALIALRNRAVAAGHRLGLVSGDGQLRDILVIAGLDRAFAHAPDVDTACSLVTTTPADAGPAVPAPRSGP